MESVEQRCMIHWSYTSRLDPTGRFRDGILGVSSCRRCWFVRWLWWTANSSSYLSLSIRYLLFVLFLKLWIWSWWIVESQEGTSGPPPCNDNNGRQRSSRDDHFCFSLKSLLSFIGECRIFVDILSDICFGDLNFFSEDPPGLRGMFVSFLSQFLCSLHIFLLRFVTFVGSWFIAYHYDDSPRT